MIEQLLKEKSRDMIGSLGSVTIGEKRVRRIILACAIVFSVSACGHKGQASADNSEDALSENVRTAASAASSSVSNDKAPTSNLQAMSFDISTIPVSTVPLGKFPYFSLPAGYEPNGPQTQDFGHFLFWTGKAMQDVEGKVYASGIYAKDGKTFSLYEVKKNLESVVQQAGGVQVTESRIPSEVSDKIPDEIKLGLINGLGDIYNNPTDVWVIHRPDRQIWIHFTGYTAAAAWTIVETKPFQQTAGLLPAAKLQDEIDKTGKAAIEVNFATDKADILPASQSQIDEVATLLGTEPALRLAVNGYTDDTGTSAHNQSLSQARAMSVVAALVAKGIAPSRLQAKGFGGSRPVADNGTDEGKAKNRRVELLRL